MDFAQCARLYSDLKLLIYVSFRLLWRVVSLAIIPHSLFIIYTEEQVISMMEFLHDNILVEFGGTNIFQQIVEIPMGSNCAPLLVELFLCSFSSKNK